MSGYEVDTGALRQHAGKLAGIKSDVEAASDAGTTTALSSDAFGIVCSFLYPHAAEVQLNAVDGIVALADLIASAGDAMKAIADAYDEVDSDVSDTFTKLLANAPVAP